LTLGVVAGIIFRPGGAESFTYIYDHWVPLVSASIAMSFFQAFWVYLASFQTRELLALGGNSGVFIYDVSRERVRAV
jgi:delta14-sterol reductase